MHSARFYRLPKHYPLFVLKAGRSELPFTREVRWYVRIGRIGFEFWTGEKRNCHFCSVVNSRGKVGLSTNNRTQALCCVVVHGFVPSVYSPEHC